MASNQGNYDNSANAPYWAGSSVHLPMNNANVALLYGNTSPNVFFSNATIGLFAVDESEVTAQGYGTPGWVLRTVGQGGRAGRVIQETLSVVSSFRSDNNSDDALYPDAVITISQPVALRSVVANTSAANVVSFSVAGTTVKPAGDTLTYQWQVNNNTGGTWVDINNGTDVTSGEPGDAHKTGADTTTLSIAPTSTAANNYVFRAVITATNPRITNSTKTVYSANSQIKIF